MGRHVDSSVCVYLPPECNLQATFSQEARELCVSRVTWPPHSVSPLRQTCVERVANEMCSEGNLFKTISQKICFPASLQVLGIALAAAELFLTTTQVVICGSRHSAYSADTCPDFRTALHGGYWPAPAAPYFTKAVTVGLDNATCWLDSEGPQGQQQSAWLAVLAGQSCQEDSLGQLLPFLLLTSDAVLCSLHVRKRLVGGGLLFSPLSPHPSLLLSFLIRFSALQLLASTVMFFASPAVCSTLHLTWNGDQKLYLYIQVAACVIRVLLCLNFDLSFSRQEDLPDHTSQYTCSQPPPVHPSPAGQGGSGRGKERPAPTGHFIEDSLQQLNIGVDGQRSAKSSWLKRVEEMELLSGPCSPPLPPPSAGTQQSLFCHSHSCFPVPHGSPPFDMRSACGAHSLNSHHRKQLVWPSRLRLRRNSLSTATAALSLSEEASVLTDCEHHIITS